MLRPLPIANLGVYSLAIPMRVRFSHAAAERVCAEPVVVRIELADHTVGYGETHPRPYVTGESHADVLRAIRETFVPILLDLRPAHFGEAIEAVAELPLTDAAGRVVTAARAAVELALLDAYARAFDRSWDSIPGWLEEPRFGPPGSRDTARFGVVISSMAPSRVAGFIRKVRLGRIRHFKLKVGDAEDHDRLLAAVRALRRGLERHTITLVVDANGAWEIEQAVDKLRSWEHLPITCVEQPLPKDAGKDWGELARRTRLPLMADESLVTPDDAEWLIVHRGAGWFNLRISKNGGLLPTLRLAATARRHGIACQLGCMVGETSILSAAGRWLLQWVPDIRLAEGSFGRFLLTDDVVRKPLRFSFGGRWAPMAGPGLGLDIDACRLRRLAVAPPIEMPF
ncbi:MAG: mandelate racemase/muconate lactonizing enzyme family protein [Phycisphaerae bacterium]